LVASVAVENRSEASKLEYIVKKTPKDRKIIFLSTIANKQEDYGD
jgi:predicted GIY-YIG superfamily endonuclease